MHEQRARLRLISLAWAFTAATTAGMVGGLMAISQGIPGSSPILWLAALEPALRAAGCGFFYGLLAFHLQRVDPDDSHLQAGLVGAVCAIRCLGAPLQSPLVPLLGSWLQLWLPLVAAAGCLQVVSQLWPGLSGPDAPPAGEPSSQP